MLTKRFIPMSALFELTLRCNMRCIHCGSSAGIQRSAELSTEQWGQIVQQLSEMNCRFIGLLGGEPFIRNDWFTIAQTIKQNGMDFSIMTNGALINDTLISKLRKLEPYNIVVSIDGGTAATHDYIRQTKGSFDQCIRTLQLLRQAGLSTSVITTVNKKNISELPLLRSFLINKEIAWQIQPAVPIGRFPREIFLSPDEFYSIALFIAATRKKYSIKELPIAGAHCIGYHSSVIQPVMLLPFWNGCPAGITTVGIQSDGGVKGCLSISDEYIEDNIRQRSFSEIWNDPKTFAYNRRFQRESLNKNCQSCRYAQSCRGGCFSMSTSLNRIQSIDPYCLYFLEKKELNTEQ